MWVAQVQGVTAITHIQGAPRITSGASQGKRRGYVPKSNRTVFLSQAVITERHLRATFLHKLVGVAAGVELLALADQRQTRGNTATRASPRSKGHSRRRACSEDLRVAGAISGGDQHEAAVAK